MRFHGLPAALHVGSAELQPVAACPEFEQMTCLACGHVAATVNICKRGHVVCELCSVEVTPQPNSIWCPVCDDTNDVYRMYMNLEVLNSICFRCKCSFEGTLGRIREHLSRQGAHEDMSSRSSGASTDVYPSDASVQGSSTSAETKSAALTYVTNATTASRADCRLDNEERHRVISTTPATCPPVDFSFHLSNLYDRFKLNPAQDNTYSDYNYVGGILYRAQFSIKRVDGREFVSMFISRANDLQPDELFPLKRAITLSVLNRKRMIVRTFSCTMIDKDRPTLSVHGTHKLIGVDALYWNNCMARGEVLVSVSIKPVQVNGHARCN